MFSFLKKKQRLLVKVDRTWEHASHGVSENLFTLVFFGFIFGVVALTYVSLQEILTVAFLTLMFGVLLWPLYRRVKSVVPGPKLLASSITLTLAVIIGIVPLFLVGKLLFQQLLDLTTMFDPVMAERTLTWWIERFNAWVAPLPVVGSYLVVDYAAVAESTISMLGAVTSSIVNLIYTSGQSAVKLFINFFLIVVVLFYALPDMDRLKAWVVENSPFSQQTTSLYLARLRSMMFDVIRGSFVISFVQALLSAIFLIALQVPAAGIISVLVFFFSLLPILGSGIVLVPLAIYYLIIGHWMMGLAVLLYQVLIVASVDNVLRPLLVSNTTNIHPAVMLLAVTGGIATLGVMGLLYGPLVIILFLTTVEVYNKEFKHKR